MSAATDRVSVGARPGRTSPDTAHVEELVTALLRRERGHPVPLRRLNQEIARQIQSQREGRVEMILGHLVDRGEVLDLGGGAYFLAENLAYVQRRICEVMKAYHETLPYDPGIPTGEIKKRFSKGKSRNAQRNIDPRLFERAMTACKEQGLIVESEGGVRLADFALTADQLDSLQRLEQAIIAYVDQRRYARLDLDELTARLGADPRKTRAVFLRAVNAGSLVQYAEDRFLTGAAMQEIRAILATEFARKARLSTAEIKTMLGVPRNAIICLLEYLDEAGFTRREGDERVLVGRGNT